ncbi:hypothetical protein FRC10_007756 [Ceratobasidium sp. 414]|nr:hypothetical protein FRC10_007756 [Ceratobasidium sp. 414]
MFPIDLDSLEILQSRLSSTASVHLRGEPGYGVQRWAENAEKPAAAVAYPANVDDVVELLAFVQGRGLYVNQSYLDVAVKGGGHSASGASSTDGGLVIDLQPHMHDVKVDAENRLAYVGGGALWKHVDQAAIEHGLAPVAGVVSHTGVGYLGGGRGWLTGQHGLVIDNLLQATVVTAAGVVLVVSAAENPDLYWAIRGGGGNFGVVTQFVFRLHPQRPTVFHHFFVFAPRMLPRLVDEINSWMKHRNDTENGSLIFALCPERTPVVVLQMIYNGDSQEGREKYQRFVELGPMMHRPETILLFDSWLDFVSTNPAASKSTVLIELYHPDKPASIPHTDTAFAFRQPNYAVLLTMHWVDPSFSSQASAASIQIDDAFEKARALAFSPAKNVGGAYLNYLDEESRVGVSKTQSKFGPNYARLVEVKLKYDPEGLFGKASFVVEFGRVTWG